MVIAWCTDDPSRVGEVVDVPAPGETSVIGRGDSAPGAARWLRRRPWGDEPRPPLTDPRLSRAQLGLSRKGQDWLKVSLLGREPVMVDGSPLTSGSAMHVTEGSLIRVRRGLLLAVVRRLELPAPPGSNHSFGEPDAHGIVGESHATWLLRARIAQLGATERHTLVLGESGTGKELAAKALHDRSPRGGRPFVSRNAATFPEGLIDAELFGNVRNYPNPGMAERAGVVGEADGGTLFLDEIGELPEALQAHLLRLLDHGEYNRLGDGRARRVDLRVIAATNRDVAAIKHDLAARMVLRLDVPPLRERRTDVPLILRHLARRLATEEPTAAAVLDDDGEPRIQCGLVERLMRHPLPSNVRQVEKVFWDAVVSTAPGQPLSAPLASLPTPAPNRPEVTDANDDRPRRRPEDVTKAEVLQALRDNDWVREDTWRALRLRSRHQLYRLMDRHGISERDDPG
ncbi:MAG: sigma 54-interacting transcriptional regulator [Myxococcales bacterium]|nr:sigma 54-interacting transcriptional regulator [Myxococcales bacterium]